MQADDDVHDAGDGALNAMEGSADLARNCLQERRGLTGADVFGYAGSGLVDQQSERQRRELSRISAANRANLAAIAGRPLLARVVIEDEDRTRTIYYVLPSTPPKLSLQGVKGKLVSSGSPVGRIAELAVGEERDVRFGVKRGETERTIRVVERLTVQARWLDGQWDGLNNWFFTENRKLTIPSLRALLGLTTHEADDLDDAMLASLLGDDAPASAVVLDGIRRPTLRRLGLPDQPIVDEYQGEIFRMPLDERLVLFGAAGTGKTTTLIRRISQKLQPDNLLEEERDSLERAGGEAPLSPDEWVMFTPTELLKHYLKEAFARERVAASDQRVRVWSDERRRLARDVLGILKTEGARRFRMRPDHRLLTQCDSAFLRRHFEVFEEYILEDGARRLSDAAGVLSGAPEANLSSVGQRLLRRLESAATVTRLVEAASGRLGLKSEEDLLRGEVRRAIQTELGKLLQKHGRSFLVDIAALADSLQAGATEVPDDDDDDDDEEQAVAEKDPEKRAVQAYRAALQSAGGALEAGRKLGDRTRAAQLMTWLGEDVPTEDVLREIGRRRRLLRAISTVKRCTQLFVDRAPTCFRRFRRDLVRKGGWYVPGVEEAMLRGDIEPAEVDALLLLMLRNARLCIEGLPRTKLAQRGWPGRLEAVRWEWQTQVFVDEATDFSAVQLAAMHELSHPRLRSFFACGDVRQRLTRQGVQSEDEFDWAVPGIGHQQVNVGYRHGKRLAALAEAVALLESGKEAVQPHQALEHIEAPPLLAEGLDGEELAEWLRARVLEIKRACQTLPTVAVFVDGDERVRSLTEELRELLLDHNIDVVPCLDGKNLGDEHSVRVFDLQHIKGLEFEAALFVGVDKLAERMPELLDKHLYVGITRASTYLGMTCVDSLPGILETTRGHFEQGGWA